MLRSQQQYEREDTGECAHIEIKIKLMVGFFIHVEMYACVFGLGETAKI